MINITIEKSKMIHEEKSAFVTFRYDEEILKAIKSLATRKYHPQEKQWEIEIKDIEKLKTLLPKEQIYVKDNTAEVLEIPEEYQFKTQPMKHQLECIRFGLNNPKIIIGDEQGLGKTAESLYIAAIKKSLFHYKHTLIICCVNKLKWNWRKEVEMHTFEQGYVLGERYTKKGKAKSIKTEDKLEDLMHMEKLEDKHFLITNIESFRDDEFANRVLYLCSTGIIQTIIVDEVHKCKNPDSKMANNFLKLSAPNILLLSGTILINDPIDLFVPLTFIGVETMKIWQFKKYYQVYREIKIDRKKRMIPVGYQHLDEIQRKVDNFKIRRMKEDVVDLPSKLIIKEILEMSPSQRDIYNEVLTSTLVEVDKIEECKNPLDKLTRLRQATSLPSLITSAKVDNCKIERMKEIVEEAVLNNRKVIVFSNWEKVVNECVKELKKYNPAKITGKTVDTEAEKERFQNDERCKVIVGTIGAMGTGYTLTAASTVIFIDSPWTAADKEQAEDRAHRIGTKTNVNCITLICKDTIDERVEEIIESKKTLSEIIVDNKKTIDFLMK